MRSRKRRASGGIPGPEAPVDEQSLLARVRVLVEPLCEYEGVELVHTEYQRESRGRVLRLYIDRYGGVTLEDCAHISRQVGDLLDIELEEMGPYSLEVSSPGVDRPISSKRDFARFEGEAVRVRTTHPIDGQRNFTGILSGVSSGNVVLMVDDRMVAIPHRQISKARLMPPLDE